MIIIPYLAWIVSLVGLLMYALSANAKISTIGLHMFWVGLLAGLLEGVHHP